jgi:hypothetical protein
MDDTAVFREDTSHDKHLEALTRRVDESGLKLNRKKGEFRKCEIKYLGMKLSSSGISMDEENLEAIQQPTSHRSQPLTSAEQRRTQPTADQSSEVRPHLCRRCRSTEDVERAATAAHTSRTDSRDRCSRRGSSDGRTCPATGRICFKSGKNDHFSSMCRSRGRSQARRRVSAIRLRKSKSMPASKSKSLPDIHV